jgi:hypothetical protein
MFTRGSFPDTKTKMPSGPAHIPNSTERSLLQRLIAHNGIARHELETGRRLIGKLLEKGWVERRDGNYFITSSGLQAFRAPIPIKR